MCKLCSVKVLMKRLNEMNDLKQKFLNFKNKQVANTQISTTANDYSAKSIPKVHLVISGASCLEISQVQDINSTSDEAILESINPAFFISEGSGVCDYIVKILPEILDCSFIVKEFEKLKQQYAVVSRKVLLLIEKEKETCKEEINNVMLIHQELNQALRICRKGRLVLSMAKHQITTISLGILVNYHKRQIIYELINSLKTIKMLQHTEQHLQELLSEGKYPEAIRLLLDCQQVAITSQQFTCVAALSSKLQDTLEMTEEQLEEALAMVCNNFDEKHYSKLQTAYCLLGKSQIAMDQLHMHFIKTVSNVSFTLIYRYLNSYPDVNEFQQLCKCVPKENFIACLIELCKAFWGIIFSYSRVVDWHHRNDFERLTDPEGKSNFETNCNKQYMKQKLNKCIERIWQDIQLRISYYLNGSDLSWYKFEQFLHILRIVSRLKAIGKEFCDSRSEDIQNSIKEQSQNYFHKYHKGRLEELRIFLENEGWEICPVKPKFNIFQLEEFHSLQRVLKPLKFHDSCGSEMGRLDCDINHSQDGSSITGYLEHYTETNTPFDVSMVDESMDEDILSNTGDGPLNYFTDGSDEDVPEEFKEDLYIENSEESNNYSMIGIRKINPCDLLKSPILTNTALTVLRQCGNYMQISQLLHLMANDVIMGMSQLIDYYMYAIHTFFTADLPDSSNSAYSLLLQSSLKNIHDSLMQFSKTLPETEWDQYNGKNIITELQMSPVVDLNNPAHLYGLSERIVAVESLVFMARELEILQGYLVQLQEHKGSRKLFRHSVRIAIDLRQPVYMCVSARAVDFKNIMTLMSKVNWEVKDIISQHSHYVDILLKELQIFSMRLEELRTQIFIPDETYTILWENIIHQTCYTFVDGFSSTKKCSNGGRALMQLDFTQFLSKLEKLTLVRYILSKEFVETYIKAYYLPEASLDKWIQEHREYSVHQLKALVSCVCQNDRKNLVRLETIIQEYHISK